MDIFSNKSKSTSSLSDVISIKIENEPEFYSPGDVVHGRVLIKNRLWRQMFVEVVVVCEEHSEIFSRTANDTKVRQRRITIAGESVEGVPTEKGGEFSFDLRIPDDPYTQNQLPSFEIEPEDTGLYNSIRWLVEARITYKNKVLEYSQDIVFIPTRPLPVTNTQQLIRQDSTLRVYEPHQAGKVPNWLFGPEKLTYTKLESPIVGVLQFPEAGLKQYPSTVPLKLALLVTHPHLIYISNISVQLISTARSSIDGEVWQHTMSEDLRDSIDIDIQPEGDMVDLSDYLSGIVIQDQCASFRGKWISMDHRLQIKVLVKSVYNKIHQDVLTINTVVKVLPPRTYFDIVDAPPMYSPLAQTPCETLAGDSASQSLAEILNFSQGTEKLRT